MKAVQLLDDFPISFLAGGVAGGRGTILALLSAGSVDGLSDLRWTGALDDV